jgi:hypothetical protein
VNIAFTASGVNTIFSVIAGDLPSGLVLKKETTSTSVQIPNPNTGVISTQTGTLAYIVGNATSVPTTLASEFVIRATNASGVSDRTFIMNVIGGVDPTWITPAGFLPVGTSGEYFTVNKQIVDYQLSASPSVLFENMKLRYYIADGDGTLPKGLTLTEDGRILGTIEEITIEEETYSKTDASYDTLKYDAFQYDGTYFLLNESVKPKYIRRVYQFYVTTSDGFNSTRKLFKMQVLDHQSLRGDTTYISADSQYFQGGDSYLFAPNWLSPANLGIRRASNYQIITIKTYDPFPETGGVDWDWNSITVNPEIKVYADTQLTDYDPIADMRFPKYNRIGDSAVYLKNLSSLPQVGQQFKLSNYLPNLGYTTTYIISSVTGTTTSCQIGIQHSPTMVGDNIIYNTTLLDDIPDDAIFFVGSAVTRPLGFELNPLTGDLYGQIPYIPAYSIDYKFTIRMTKTDRKTGQTNNSDRVFQLRLQGSVNTDLAWITTSTVGTIQTGHQSELAIKAAHENFPDLGVQYKFVSGELPTGLEFKNDGSIVGKIPYNSTTEIDYTEPTDFTIDDGITTVDRTYTFTAQATNSYRLATVEKEFSIYIDDNLKTPFSSVYVRPFMNRTKRRSFRDFINNSDIFDYRVLYRPSDAAFGLQQEIKMVIEYGIERLNLAEYVVGLQNYFYNKKFFFGDVKTLPAEDANGNYVYDIVYVDIIDNMISNAGKSPDYISFLINSDLVDVYTGSVVNWQKSLESITIYGETIKVDEYLRPRFMRTITSTGAPLGFIKAVPLCYTLPGEGYKTLRKIQLSNFDFKLLDFEVDRLIIDQTFDYSGDKYLKFPIKNADSARPLNLLAGPDGIIITDEFGTELFIE